ncbi:MAG: FAD:protein FMN transferase [Wujia sp.]
MQAGKRLVLVCKMLAIALCLIGIYAYARRQAENAGNKGQNTDYSFAMGTSVSIAVYDSDDTQAKQLAQTVRQLDEDIISWRAKDSELANWNRQNLIEESNKLSDTLFTAIAQSYDICEASEGALDITLRPLADVWGIEEQTAETFVPPTKEQIKEAQKKIGYEKLSVNTKTREVIRGSSDVSIDLGAVGKGYALDVVKEQLLEKKIQGATVAIGGSVLIFGRKWDDGPFRIGVRNPDGDREDMIGYLEFPGESNLCISTSGDYEKYVEYEGRRYHHILDRTTGAPASTSLRSVTVVCENGLQSDGLSTACFVLGEEKARELLTKYQAEAVFVYDDQTVRMTDGLKVYWKGK